MSKKSGPSSRAAAPPSANWLALQKVLPKPARKRAESQELPRKRRKIDHSRSPSPRSVPLARVKPQPSEEREGDAGETMKNGESLPALRRMVFGQLDYSDIQQQPGKYLALDCEMVGVGPEGVESSLARVSLVNFHGAVQLDEFVRQRERVVDYRTEFSGVRESDMVNAKSFPAIQARVAALIKDRILVGHAVYNDLKALLLSHPHTATRDTQYYAGKFGVVKSKHIALRKLVQQEVGATIQGGEHSSVTDARATMAVYRLHRKEWERGAPRPASASAKGKTRESASAPADDEQDEDDVAPPAHAVGKNKTGRGNKERTNSFPGGGRKGVSSGLSTVVRRSNGASAGGEKTQTAWWKELGGSKGSMRV
ncbi:ribonuclease H-like domain-containing protein [Mycena capillaripes]|nr:ribonuclease H-like domain-containing protein [Mycena capillaripes]